MRKIPQTKEPLRAGRDREAERLRARLKATAAFTLIELLVVIAIIGLLAAITMGVTGVASRTMKKSRMDNEISFLVSAIENYRSTIGVYPYDNPAGPFPNPLFYELAGCVFENGRFQALEGGHVITTPMLTQHFNRSGVQNSKRNRDEVKIRTEFRDDQYVVRDDGLVLLAAPVRARGGEAFYWNYVVEGATNNPTSFDLWVDLKMGGETYRFSNWGGSRKIQ